MSRPLVLVTNDDGVDSFFLELLVLALRAEFEVVWAVPATEQSWIGRAVSLGRTLTARPAERFGTPGFIIDGTPTDCVNLALGRLLPEPPAVVVSGMNIGFNVTLPIILASGTVAGAVEGALWGLPAVAVSQQIPHGRYDALKAQHGRGDAEVEIVARASTARATEAIAALWAAGPSGLVVHNLNFPAAPATDTRIERTRPALLRLGGLFAPLDEGGYRFRFPGRREVIEERADDDLSCLLRGHASHTVLDLRALGERLS